MRQYAVLCLWLLVSMSHSLKLLHVDMDQCLLFYRRSYLASPTTSCLWKPLQRNVALMSRKRERKCWKAGVLIEQKRHVEVGRDFPKPLARCLREFVEEIKVNESLAADCLQVCCGTSRYPFRIGNGSELDPGAHWLIIGTEIDWQSITRRRAEAYACHGVISTLCATKDQ